MPYIASILHQIDIYFLNMYLHLRKMILYMMSRKFKPNDFKTKKNKSQKILFEYSSWQMKMGDKSKVSRYLPLLIR